MTKMEGYGYGRYDAARLDEGFDLSGSDVDYTDTFSDMDQDAELISEFAKGLMPALWVQDCAGKRRFAGQLDPVARSWGKLTSVEDPMLALIGCCVIDGNGDITLDVSDITGWMDPADPVAYGVSAVGITTNPWAKKAAGNLPAGSARRTAMTNSMYWVMMTLRLDKASAAWRKRFGGRWRIESAGVREFVSGATGTATVNTALNVIPGKDGSLRGCPRFVRGSVSVDSDGPARSSVRGAYSAKSRLRTLDGAPAEVTGIFSVYNAELLATVDGAGWFNHAPKKAGGVMVMCSDTPGRQMYALWGPDGRVTAPALTDGVSRSWGDKCTEMARLDGTVAEPVSVDISGGAYDHMAQPDCNVPDNVRPKVAAVPAGMTVEKNGW